MGASIQKTFTLMLGGTSLTSPGRLATPPIGWPIFLLEDMMAAPECQGPIRIINTAQGSQTSNFGAAQAALRAPLRPTHVLMEDFAINDCAIGPVTIPQATANFNSMVASYRAANPNVIIVHQTMSPAGAADVNRVNLPAYYNNGLANAALNGLLSLDNYYGTPLVPGGWPKPLPLNLTVPTAPFTITPTASYLPMATGTTWNPADKSASVSLTDSDLTANSSLAGFAGVRANNPMTGLVHFEFVFTGSDGSYPGVGIANLASVLAPLGGTNNSIGVSPSGDVFFNNVSLGNVGFTLSNGTTYAIEVNVAAKLFYVMNATTRSAGFSFAALTGAIYPIVSFNSSGDLCTAKFTTDPDGLHPIWENAFQLYSYPNIKAWARQAMADFW